eukprot:Seg1953.3 transcript_id=Seg1953.3/GoldUCD/mRNA.D3Y31 product="Synaptic vesicle 2-related protein" protein_id=Seg1953.3/GoldUCD/D3Y31
MEYNNLNGDFVHKCIEAIGFGKFHVLMLMSLGFRCFVRGSSNCMLAILQPYLRCHLKLSIFTASWLGTTLAIGRLLGAIPIGRMADKFGRRRSMLCLFSLHILLSLLNALSSSYTMILITRASIGLVFEAVMLVYTYGMELLPIKKRNYLAVIDGFQGLGTLFAIFSAVGMLEIVNWRWYVVVTETIPIAICTLLVVFLPESPRYLYSHGYEQEAVKSLEKIAAINGVDLHKILSEANISLEDESHLFTKSNEKNCEADSLERAQNDSFVTEEAPLQRNRSKPANAPLPSTTKEKGIPHPHQGGGSWPTLGIRDRSSEHTFLLQSDERQDKGAEASLEAKAHTTSNTRLPKSELYKRIFILACLRFAVQVFTGVFSFGSMQFKHLSSKIACGSCSTSMNYKFILTYAVAVETGFLLSYFMSGKYNRRFALQVVFSFRALIVIPFYFGISQWVEIPFFFIAGIFHFSSFIIVNIYGSEVIPTSHRAVATGIENTVGNVALFIGDFFVLYIIHISYYGVLVALQGLTIIIIIIISVFVINSKNVPLFDS